MFRFCRQSWWMTLVCQGQILIMTAVWLCSIDPIVDRKSLALDRRRPLRLSREQASDLHSGELGPLSTTQRSFGFNVWCLLCTILVARGSGLGKISMASQRWNNRTYICFTIGCPNYIQTMLLRYHHGDWEGPVWRGHLILQIEQQQSHMFCPVHLAGPGKRTEVWPAEISMTSASAVDHFQEEWMVVGESPQTLSGSFSLFSRQSLRVPSTSVSHYCSHS